MDKKKQNNIFEKIAGFIIYIITLYLELSMLHMTDGFVIHLCIYMLIFRGTYLFMNLFMKI